MFKTIEGFGFGSSTRSINVTKVLLGYNNFYSGVNGNESIYKYFILYKYEGTGLYFNINI